MTNYVTPQTWEQCAAHVEAGGVVEIEDAPGVWINDRAATTIYRGRCGTPDDGWAPRRLVPIESAAAPVTGDDLRERIARAIYEEEHDGPWKNANHPDWVQSLRSADAVLAVLPPQPAPSPAPPWPGAVLSGLVDEDGVPTWLAQAGDVRGGQVRSWYGSGWVTATQYAWVEVRAPRAVPAPETERVPWWAAVGRWTTGDELIVEVARTSVVPVVTVEGGGRVRVAPDGTVEVLARDGDQ